jgi:hypothetical protein
MLSSGEQPYRRRAAASRADNVKTPAAARRVVLCRFDASRRFNIYFLYLTSKRVSDSKLATLLEATTTSYRHAGTKESLLACLSLACLQSTHLAA